MNEAYQELRDAGYEEADLERRIIQNGETLQGIRDEAVREGFLEPQGSGDFSIGGNVWPGLSKLAEEASEVGQVIGKIIGAEGRHNHWDGSHLPTRLAEEMSDVEAAILFVRQHNPCLDALCATRVGEKLTLFNKWHRETLSKRKGTI